MGKTAVSFFSLCGAHRSKIFETQKHCQSFRFDDPAQPRPTKPPGCPDTGFRAISGAAVSANTSTPITVLQFDDICDEVNSDAAAGQYHHRGYNAKTGSNKGFVAGASRAGCNSVSLDGFESTSSFSALPLQRAPRGYDPPSAPLERAFFMSGPIERGALSGPLDGAASGENNGDVPFSAPLGGIYVKKRKKKKSISGMRKALYRNLSVVPVMNFISGGGRKELPPANDGSREGVEVGYESNVQWALGKAGEDRVHVVVSEELGWLFVGIYDGFNGPDAPEFLMSHLYKAMHNELEGLFWDKEDVVAAPENTIGAGNPSDADREGPQETQEMKGVKMGSQSQIVKKVQFGGENIEVRRRRLWEFLVDDDPGEGLDLSGSERFAFSVDDALSVNDAGSAVNRRSLLLSKLKHGLLSRHKDKEGRRLFPWKFWLEGKNKTTEEMRENNNVADNEREKIGSTDRKRKIGVVDHELVLSAMSRALEVTEQAYLDMTDRVLDRYPELALMGSCLLVVLMRDEDVYVMNVGDSRAIVAQCETEDISCGIESQVPEDGGFTGDRIVEESASVSQKESRAVNEAHAHHCVNLTALQLSTDHSTSIEEEVIRIKNEHPDDSNCIVNDRVKGRLKVTRAFGAGFLKQHKWNDALLEMFRNDYIGTAPYISCSPSLRHHKLYPRDQFLVLSSDGLYQYFSNQEVVSHVQNFMERFPDGDPAQHLIEELLFRAARKAGMDFHELLDIPQGDRRKYHDDVTVMVVSLEGRIWKSSGKYL
ncbi:Protein phosphatase 2C 29 [Striga hermonthica]|uniref:Protein phosphatase 2C 29 n=1 Tax=Striga hermonthica TaxID=68872 RepID=A0A9N7RN89_STRHE|nr:Protein phosphatase 2C 29 [Striga hermonthica]